MERKPRGRPRSTAIPALGEVAERFGDAVRRLREARDWNQADMARAVAAELGKQEHEFHPTTLAKVERGTRPTPLDEAAAIARVLGQPLERILADPAVTTKRLQRLRADLLTATAEYEEARRERREFTAELAAISARAAPIKKRIQQAEVRLQKIRSQLEDEEAKPDGKSQTKT